MHVLLLLLCDCVLLLWARCETVKDLMDDGIHDPRGDKGAVI